jgi:hypothetical protein
MCSLLFALIAMATSGQPAVTPAPPAPLRHIRPLDSVATDLVSSGSRASSTLTQLVAALDRAPGLVIYVSTTSALDRRGSIVFVSRASGVTYLLVRVCTRQVGADRIAVLAHELEHAAEIAQAASPITSEADLQRLYAGIGLDSSGQHLESTAAVRAERAVHRELGK